jgi:hypothetical protein
VTTVEGITVVGQRRVASGLGFPIRPSGGGGGGGTSGGEEENTLPDDPNWGQPELLVQDPCANPASALAWNADAAGAGAVAKFLLKAAELGFADAPGGTPSLLNREFGAYLTRGSGSSVTTGPVTAGPPRNQTDPNAVSEIIIDTTGVTTLNYQGDVHSHPNGNPLPSQADWVGFMATNNDARKAGRTNETFFMYVIAIDQNGGPPKIYVYQDGPRAANSAVPPRPTEVGPEVNPDAQPCS